MKKKKKIHYWISTYEEYQKTHAKKCEKVFFGKLLWINYFGIFFLMKKSGGLVSPRKMNYWGSSPYPVIECRDWYSFLVNIRRKPPLPLTRRERILADRAAASVKADPLFYGLTAAEKEKAIQEAKRAIQKGEELKQLEQDLKKSYGLRHDLNFTLVILGAYYLNNQEIVLQKLNNFFSVTVGNRRRTEKVEKKIEKFLAQYAKELDEDCEAEHMTSI